MFYRFLLVWLIGVTIIVLPGVLLIWEFTPSNEHNLTGVVERVVFEPKHMAGKTYIPDRHIVTVVHRDVEHGTLTATAYDYDGTPNNVGDKVLFHYWEQSLSRTGRAEIFQVED